MEIYGASRLNSAQPVYGAHRTNHVEQVDTPNALHGADQVEISAEAELVSRVHETQDIRADRVDEIRRQIAAGVYETSDKLDVALGRLLDEIAS
jgi:negative regulator of flagellin synthesis FlgM